MEGRRWTFPRRRESRLPEVFQHRGEIGTDWREKFTRRASNRRVRSKAAEGGRRAEREWVGTTKTQRAQSSGLENFQIPKLGALYDLMVKMILCAGAGTRGEHPDADLLPVC